ncbi:sphingosine kinase 1 [Elysia marginata]|uniref:Sphingosine kinase 1 n=1 Tax=Elysia marginata TaxID=1093978 RepID=A0AAV4EW78_9GAST|nr:sphingosine kinase 1 [Elysia marginata]
MLFAFTSIITLILAQFETVADGPVQKLRQFFVLINPYSGRKTAGRIFHKKVAPLLTACGVNFRIHETRGPGDAAAVCRDLDFSTLDGPWLPEVVGTAVRPCMSISTSGTGCGDEAFRPSQNAQRIPGTLLAARRHGVFHSGSVLKDGRYCSDDREKFTKEQKWRESSAIAHGAHPKDRRQPDYFYYLDKMSEENVDGVLYVCHGLSWSAVNWGQTLTRYSPERSINLGSPSEFCG